ncbi:MAG: OmpA family protein [Bacteroidales bacterium]|jgi:outer membrane protein OmpA-like peptidoglycan-associated protein|nr:OmpA family protein [Bacteroidales bacterium]
MKKFFLIVVIISAGLMTARAQEKGLYIGLSGNVGIAELKWEQLPGVSIHEGGKNWSPWGYGGSLNVQYFFNEYFGIATGLGLQHYKGRSLLNASWETDKEHYLFANMVDNSPDSRYQNCDVQISLSKWEERQKAWLLEIPVMAAFQRKFGTKEAFGLYANAGIKIQIPVSKSYEVYEEYDEGSGDRVNVGGSQLHVEAYYPSVNQILDNIPNHGYGTTGVRNSSGEIEKVNLSGKPNLKLSVSLSAEFGMLISMSRRWDLSLGVYIDKGLNNMKPANADEKGRIFHPQGNQLQVADGIGKNLVYEGVWASYATRKVSTLAYGGKMGIRVKIGKLKDKQEEDELIKSLSKALQQQQKGRDTIIVKFPDSLLRYPYPGGGAYYPGNNIPEGAYPAQYAQGGYPAWYTPYPGDSLYGKYPAGGAMQNPRFSSIVDTLIESIYFDLDKAVLRKKSIEVLDRKVALMQRYPGLQMAVVGHTCDLGSEGHNDDLSMRRARAAREYMIMKGISPSRIEVVPMGKRNPTYPNSSEYNREHNRRVDFIIVR